MTAVSLYTNVCFHLFLLCDSACYSMTAMGHCSTPQIKARTEKDSCGYFEKRDET
nr:MAG TPA: hypothetical protein [Caudoviricetes sp.]